MRTTTTRPFAHPLAHALDRMGTLSRMLDQVIPDAQGNALPVWVPSLEVVERGDAYLIAAELPGVREDQVELSFENNVLTVRGTKAPTFTAAENTEQRVHVFERQTGTFERSVRLPEYVEGDRIDAQFADGVLVVTVPKARAAQPRRIPLNGGANVRLGGDAAPAAPSAEQS